MEENLQSVQPFALESVDSHMEFAGYIQSYILFRLDKIRF